MQKIVTKVPARLIVVCALTLAFMAIVAPVSHAATTNTQEADEKAVRDTLVQSAAGFEKNDLVLLTRVWANDETLTVFESGHANYGWADYRDNHLVPEMKEMRNAKYALSEIKIHLAGKTAWATFKYAISADIEGRHIEGGGLGTAVLEERDNRWQIVHWHSSAPRRQPPATAKPAGKKQ